MAASAFIINFGAIAATLGFMIGMGDTFKGPTALNTVTTVQLVLGVNSTQSSGDPPSISLFNNHGEPTGRWSPYRGFTGPPIHPGGPAVMKREGIKAGETWSVDIAHGDSVSQTRWWPPKHGETAGYVLLSASEDQNCNGQLDGICVSAVMVSDVNQQTLLFGDIPAQCGASWYWGSQTVRFQSTEYISKCFWLDWDSSSGDNSARSISFHIQSMKGSPDRAAEYKENGWDMMCKSTPRFSYWEKLKPHSWIPFFDPPLEFKPDSKSGSPFGLDVDPQRIIDNPLALGGTVYDHGVERYNPPGMDQPYLDSPSGPDNMDPCHTPGRRRRRQVPPKPKARRLIISPMPEHSGSELCQSPTSRGPDFVSIEEGTFCDMDTKTVFPLCDDRQGIKTDCFALKTNSMMLASPRTRDGRAKVYDLVENW